MSEPEASTEGERAMEADRRSVLMTVAHGVRRVWWFVRRPVVVGAAGLVVDEEGRVLLVRQSYATRRWTLPGGGVKRGETMRDAALREVREEAGVVATAPDDVELLGVYSNFKQAKSDHVAVFVIREWQREATSDLEIANKGFFAADELPSPLSGATRRRIEEFLGRRSISPRW
jgi:ADP-ribose pyrophosphatase YjhB (NUDIX family)